MLQKEQGKKMVELDWLVLHYRITVFFVSQFKNPRGTPAFIRSNPIGSPHYCRGIWEMPPISHLKGEELGQVPRLNKGLYLEVE